VTENFFQFEHDGLVFDVAESGPADGEAVVLLHGFPEAGSSWSNMTPSLAAGGCRVLAPDQRGYSPGARPPAQGDYALDRLVADVLSLADNAGLDRFHLVGHDWGGAVAWALASKHPDRLRTLAVLSTPHPKALGRSLLRSDQVLRSSYVGLFRLPVVSERLLLAFDGRVLEQGLRRAGLSAAKAREYTARMSEPGALTAALNWYRANTSSLAIGDVDVPTLYIWSTGDAALGRRAAELTADYVKGPYRFEVLDGVSHWIPEEAPDEAAALLLSFWRT